MRASKSIAFISACFYLFSGETLAAPALKGVETEANSIPDAAKFGESLSTTGSDGLVQQVHVGDSQIAVDAKTEVPPAAAYEHNKVTRKCNHDHDHDHHHHHHHHHGPGDDHDHDHHHHHHHGHDHGHDHA
ncbi:hypothetical protein BY996DRAFT_6536607 [Phakopsora pachyrhizi]|nr:hypothetical protein BY996DRAFT_6536607 [Phakopsora pachyrhizi]